MDILKAILSMLISFLFLGFLFRIAWPLIVIILMLILFASIRTYFVNKKYKEERERQSQQYRQQRSSRQQQSTRPQDPNVIDAEYTEEELD